MHVEVAAEYLGFAPLAWVGDPLVTREAEEAEGLLAAPYGVAQGLDVVPFVFACA